MAIPVKNNPLTVAGFSKNAARIANPQAVNNQGSFNAILEKSLQKTETSSSGGIDLQSLSREQMDILVKNMQIQMNRQLFNIAFNSEEKNCFPGLGILADYMGSLTTSLTEVSKNRQMPSPNDFSPGRLNLDSIIEKAARRYEVDPDLVRSVIKAESNFNPQALSPQGAMGLMQLMPETAEELGVKNAYDPEENIMGGTKYLKLLLNRYDGKRDQALAAYNWGMGNLEKNQRSLPAETANYIARIDGYYKNLKESA